MSVYLIDNGQEYSDHTIHFVETDVEWPVLIEIVAAISKVQYEDEKHNILGVMGALTSYTRSSEYCQTIEDYIDTYSNRIYHQEKQVCDLVSNTNDGKKAAEIINSVI